MVTGAYSGVAKNAHLISIKVCRKRDNCDRVNVIRGLLWAQWNEKNRRDKAAPHSRGGAVVNMSLQVGATKTMSDLIDKLFTQNIPVFAAAGNSGGLGEDNYPCKHPLVNCVGATTEDYNRWKGIKRPGGSASGGKVMFVAPGGGIIATWPKELKDANHEGFCKDKPCMEASGTSFASPVAAGVAAMILSYEGRLNHLSSFTPASVFGRLKENARTGITEGWRGGGEKYFINNGFHKGHNGEPYYMPPQP
jgi:subtilisin family serine protease